MTTRNRFMRGTGCFTCNRCGRKTRSTGRGDNENVGLCRECYDLCGIENEISDGGRTEADAHADIVFLKNTIIAKGGIIK